MPAPEQTSPLCGRISPRAEICLRRARRRGSFSNARSNCSTIGSRKSALSSCTALPAARAAADRSSERWRAGKPLSPIDGMPVGIKDIIETVDMPTQMGSPLFAGWRSEKDAACVRALRDAGAVILGKTVTTEFAASEPRGTRNPWNIAHTPGGSSSGSAAAVAAGIVSAALGTQVIGSTIRPASFCGCVGFKPSVNALNREGSHDYQSQSCTGILGASLADVWQIAHEIVARVGGDAGTPGLQGPDTLPPAQRAAPPRRARNRRLGQRVGRRQAAARRVPSCGCDRPASKSARGRTTTRLRRWKPICSTPPNCRTAATAGRRAGSCARCATATPAN